MLFVFLFCIYKDYLKKKAIRKKTDNIRKKTDVNLEEKYLFGCREKS